MDKVTQANAANAEESASASEELSAQAGQMNRIVDDLSNMVGGGRHRTDRPRAHRSQQREEQRLSTSDQTFHQISQGQSRKWDRVTASRDAEHKIPLNDDDSIEEFNS